GWRGQTTHAGCATGLPSRAWHWGRRVKWHQRSWRHRLLNNTKRARAGDIGGAFPGRLPPQHRRLHVQRIVHIGPSDIETNLAEVIAKVLAKPIEGERKGDHHRPRIRGRVDLERNPIQRLAEE